MQGIEHQGVAIVVDQPQQERAPGGEAARAGALYAYEFTEKSRFEAKGAYLLNLENTEDSQGDAKFSLTAPVAGRLALKLSYDFLYRNQPLPGLEKLDTTFSVGVQAIF